MVLTMTICCLIRASSWRAHGSTLPPVRLGGTPDLLEALCRNASGEESVETQTICRAELAGDRALGLLLLASARARGWLPVACTAGQPGRSRAGTGRTGQHQQIKVRDGRLDALK